MRIAGGQEIGQACDFTVAADTAGFGQAGTRHGSSPTGGSTDFLPWNLSMEQAMWQAVSNEVWSAYKMERMGLITKAIPIKKNGKGEWVSDPRVITDKYTDNNQIVFGEFKQGEEAKKAAKELKALKTDFSLLDDYIERMVWTLTNTMVLNQMNTIDSIRVKKKFFWDMLKKTQVHSLAFGTNVEFYLGMNAFNTQKLTGTREIDFMEYRRQLAKLHPYDDDLAEKVVAKPKK
jgi:6-oxo-cyclohex-1-ene-carbonyl-CoA hydrolase